MIGMVEHLRAALGVRPVASIALNLHPVSRPWGGGNQWAAQMAGFFRSRGYSVRSDLSRTVDCVILADPRMSGTATFGTDALAAYLDRHPATTVIHRINESDQRKGTAFMDDLLAAANRLADHTVFISDWLRRYHQERWFDPARPHSVIVNGADPRVFHPIGAAPGPKATGSLRIVTHHWSDNPMKGFAVYEAVDRMIADGDLPGVELWVIGRWPRDVRWRAARTFPPTRGRRLADLLRQCHAYITASLWEPGGMHYIEGAQCGLPVLYHEDGGGIVEVARRFGIGFRDDVGAAVLEMRARYGELRSAVLRHAPSGDVMCVDYFRVVQQAIAEGKR